MHDRPPLLPPKVGFAGVDFHPLNLDQCIVTVAGRPASEPFAYVVTPNADHIVRLNRERDALLPAYEGAWLCVNDSRVSARLARMQGRHLPPVPGADLVAELLGGDRLSAGDTISLIGGDDELGALLRNRLPHQRIVQHQPPMGLRSDPTAMEHAARFVEANPARFILLAVGSPQQELLAHLIHGRGHSTGIALCIGAGLAFFVGRQSRAPLWVRRRGLEWAYRLICEPRRLARRYLVDSPALFGYAWKYRSSR